MMSSVKNRQVKKISYIAVSAAISATLWVLAMVQLCTGSITYVCCKGGTGAFLNQIISRRATVSMQIHTVFEENGSSLLLLAILIILLILLGTAFFIAMKKSRFVSAIILGAAMTILIITHCVLRADEYLMTLLFFASAVWSWFLALANELGEAKLRKIFTSALPLLCLTICIAVALSAAAEYQLSETAEAWGNELTKNVEIWRFGGSESGMTGGDFSLIGQSDADDETVLSLTMTDPQSYYLRGYIGHSYTGKGWSDLVLEGESEKSANALHYGLQEENFASESMLAEAAVLTGFAESTSEDANVISVVNKGASRRYFYLPYETDAVESTMQRLTNGEISTQGFRGENRYTIIAKPYLLGRYPLIKAELAENTADEDIAKYLMIEYNYRKFVYEHYLQISDSTKAAIENIFPERTDNIDSGIAKANIIESLNDFEYRRGYACGTEGEDVLTEFFAEKKGAAAYFATAAAMAFRYYGIPARFCEGYLITDDMIEGINAGEEIKLTAVNCHSWAEYYEDGVGWIPFEVTPDYIGMMGSAESISAAAETSETPQENKSADTVQKDDEELVSSETEVNYLSLFILIILLIFAAVLCTAALVKRKAGRGYRKKDFRNTDRRIAVLALMKFIRKTEKKKAVPPEMVADYEWISRIYEETRYSLHEIKEADYLKVFEFADRFKKYKMKRGK